MRHPHVQPLVLAGICLLSLLVAYTPPATEEASGLQGSEAERPSSSTSGLLIRDGWVVTMDAENRLIENGAVAIEDGRIVAVDTSSSCLRSVRTPARCLPKAARLCPA